MIHNITIKPVLNGFICTVGCQTVVFNSVNELINQLDVYLRHPEDTEKFYRNGAINKYLLDPPAPPQPVNQDNIGDYNIVGSPA